MSAKRSLSCLQLVRVDHNTKLSHSLEDMRTQDSLTDVTFACEGEMVRAHRVVLASSSHYFRRLFAAPGGCLHHHPVIIIKDMTLSDLTAIIEFMYRGEVTVPQEQLASLIKSAETLQVNGLSQVDPKFEHHVGEERAPRPSDTQMDTSDAHAEERDQQEQASSSSSKSPKQSGLRATSSPNAKPRKRRRRTESEMFRDQVVVEETSNRYPIRARLGLEGQARELLNEPKKQETDTSESNLNSPRGEQSKKCTVDKKSATSAIDQNMEDNLSKVNERRKDTLDSEEDVLNDKIKVKVPKVKPKKAKVQEMPLRSSNRVKAHYSASSSIDYVSNPTSPSLVTNDLQGLPSEKSSTSLAVAVSEVSPTAAVEATESEKKSVSPASPLTRSRLQLDPKKDGDLRDKYRHPEDGIKRTDAQAVLDKTRRRNSEGEDKRRFGLTGTKQLPNLRRNVCRQSIETDQASRRTTQPTSDVGLCGSGPSLAMKADTTFKQKRSVGRPKMKARLLNEQLKQKLRQRLDELCSKKEEAPGAQATAPVSVQPQKQLPKGKVSFKQILTPKLKKKRVFSTPSQVSTSSSPCLSSSSASTSSPSSSLPSSSSPLTCISSPSHLLL